MGVHTLTWPPSTRSGNPSGKAALSGVWQGTNDPLTPSVGITPQLTVF